MPSLFLLKGFERLSESTSRDLKPARGNLERSSVPPVITASQIPFSIHFLAVEKAFIPEEHAVDTPQYIPSSSR